MVIFWLPIVSILECSWLHLGSNSRGWACFNRLYAQWSRIQRMRGTHACTRLPDWMQSSFHWCCRMCYCHWCRSRACCLMRARELGLDIAQMHAVWKCSPHTRAELSRCAAACTDKLKHYELHAIYGSVAHIVLDSLWPPALNELFHRILSRTWCGRTSRHA